MQKLILTLLKYNYTVVQLLNQLLYMKNQTIY